MEEDDERDEQVARSTMTVADAWASYAATARVDVVTLKSYESRYFRHVDPVLGPRRVASTSREDVEALLAGIASRGAGAELVRQCRVVLGLLLRRAREVGAIREVPTGDVLLPRQARSAAPRGRVMTPQEFLLVREALPTPGARLLADLLVRSGLRIGEALALQPQDVLGDSLVVRRRLVEPGRSSSEDGQRFALRSGTKSGQERRVEVGGPFAAELQRWCEQHHLADGDLLFPRRLVLPEPSGKSFPAKIHTTPLTPERLAELGSFTGPNGRTYGHGTVNGYTTGACRCASCRQAVSEYSSARRRARRDQRAGAAPPRSSATVPPGRGGEAGADAFPGVSRHAWAAQWSRAVKNAGLEFRPLARQTRHTHASWLSGAGVSSERVAGRLGHRDERSTSRYVRPVGPEADPVAAVEALLRQESPPGGSAEHPDL
ncbi:tyrosine-type recombinase/integrase [Quadrisphaera setariae]|uniref:Tyrosine-type recombinase/integrase n=1 Tax=Quadrisphaera setariae TaxID=2593304 RepID=A0A5C8ZHN4_9ACTN|nr:site-specific integrase [Quadrisphaera setariae]TXR56688.1 tyrosine-type recombinase/integrase [Quadrisphaera setariae]